MSKPRTLTALQRRWLAECERRPGTVPPGRTSAALIKRGLVTARLADRGYSCRLTPAGRAALGEAKEATDE